MDLGRNPNGGRYSIWLVLAASSHIHHLLIKTLRGKRAFLLDFAINARGNISATTSDRNPTS